VYKLLLDRTDLTPEAPQHLFCDVCGKQVESMKSCIMLATDAVLVNGLPRHFIIACKGKLSEDRKSWEKDPCSADNENEYPASYELTYNFIYRMSLISLNHYRREKKLELANASVC
jgi:hypothetical protein